MIIYFDAIAISAGISGHKNLGTGADLDKPVTVNSGRKVLEDTPRTLMKKGEVDVWLTTDVAWAERPDLKEFGTAGLAGNPNFRLYQQARFLVEKHEERDNSKIADVQAALDKARGSKSASTPSTRKSAHRLFSLFSRRRHREVEGNGR